MIFIDTHAHVYSDQFKNDQSAMLERAVNKGLKQILMPAIDSETHEAMLGLEASNPSLCVSMMGLHPCSVKEDYENELAIIEKHLESRKFIGVGEIGLDYYWDLNYKEQQLDAFNRQVEWALKYDLPISIHSREATPECIEVVRKYQNGKLKGVFHCFSGTTIQANEIMELGFYLGIGGVVTFKNGGLDKVIAEIGLERIVLETDAPYLAPVPFRGKRNEPSYLEHVAQKIADLKQMNIAEVARITTENAQKLFGL